MDEKAIEGRKGLGRKIWIQRIARKSWRYRRDLTPDGFHHFYYVGGEISSCREKRSGGR